MKTCTSRVAEGVHPRSSAGSAAHDPGPSGEAAAAPPSQHPVPGGASSGALPGVRQLTLLTVACLSCGGSLDGIGVGLWRCGSCRRAWIGAA